MLRIIIVFVILNFYNPALTSMKEDIISKMQITNNLSFNFIQTVDEKSESGMCILEYPKKFIVNMMEQIKRLLFQMESH